MAVFVLGAGATRGASFVDPSRNACLPPLDTDFYSQLQRIKNKKHETIIKQVIHDTVELFGVNFNITMETVFTTLEHIFRMIHTTGENRDFNRDEIRQKQARLMQAIAATMEEALCPEGYEGSECTYHTKLVELLKTKDEIISFNYDCLIDETLKLLQDRFGMHDMDMDSISGREEQIYLGMTIGSLNCRQPNQVQSNFISCTDRFIFIKKEMSQKKSSLSKDLTRRSLAIFASQLFRPNPTNVMKRGFLQASGTRRVRLCTQRLPS